MQPNPIASLLRSRKFLLAMLDALVASVALVLTWFLSPDKVASVLALIGIWQPVCIAVIIGIAAEDAANVKAGAEKYTADQKVVEAHIYDAAIKAEPCDEPKPVSKIPNGFEDISGFVYKPNPSVATTNEPQG